MLGIDDALLTRIERDHAQGLTSVEILDLFARAGIALSEATLRKYVQLGLLPRSVRVGRKGKHQGSQGIYPVGVVRQILRIKQMMAQDYTIEQIQREFLFMRSDLQALEQTLEGLFEKLTRIVNEKGRADAAAKAVARDVREARVISKDLLARLGAIESRLTSRERMESKAVAS
jgi:DNA-binding transcriptional MerR regulator